MLWLLLLSLSAQADWENPVRAKLKAGDPVIGATITVASPDVAARAASLGFDFLWIEMEHSPISLETARSMILATRGLPAMPFIRVPVNELWTAKRALDMGALGVIFPFTSTPDLARQAAAATKYPPEGKRGYGPGLASSRWPAPEGYAAFAQKNVMTIIIIEEARAVERIEEIAATPGIDVLFIGINDLSYSLGVGGSLDHEKVRAALARVLAAGKKNNVAVGLPAGSPADIERRRKEGFLFFQAPSELGFLAAGAAPLLQSLGKKAPDPKTRPLY
jgi:2-keto-3-deoxy-L-rhamnonate aldolase RhmA